MSTQQQLLITDCLVKEFVTDYKTMNSFQARVILMEAIDCIKIASKHGGKVFGGFVRDIVIPSETDPHAEVSLKDIDIWFKTDDLADAFRAEMGDRFSESSANLSGESMGEFSRYCLYLRKCGTNLIAIDVIVANRLPVSDFDVNTVNYSLTEEGKWITDSPQYLVDKIVRKEATMLPTYIDKLRQVRRENPLGLKSFYKRIDRIFISKGWKIFLPQQIFLSYDDEEKDILFSSTDKQESKTIPEKKNRYTSDGPTKTSLLK